ncbi:hypothetical protein Pla175_09340 [Pirellulimonas nuda]|uniref:Uncharacterized protein n=1 Tax=Pirellulimonas nuda TaxID=2528009 RepID=A0A518D7X8_9BACT|nr:hypothetical protein [Pirellulimonas nuda]QDU87569.1 hypothetical protein Pla175_09340 [Pirellulimonas nuda]
MHPLKQQVEQLASRLRRRGRAAAGLTVVSLVVGAALALMLADALLRPSDPGLRWIALGLVLGLAAWALYRWREGLSGRGWTPLAAARRLEQRQPALGSRLSSALAFVDQREDDPLAGSSDLRRAVVMRATSELERVDVETALDRAPLQRGLRAAGAVAAAALLFLFVAPHAFLLAGQRLAAPWAQAYWPRLHHLEVVDPPTRLARGGRFETSVIDASGTLPESVALQFRSETNGRSRVDETPMRPAGDRFVLDRENVQRSFAFRAVGGDDETMRWIEVEVVDPPAVEKFSVEVAPPEYTGVAPAGSDRHLRVLDGSRVTLRGEAKAPIAAAQVRVGGAVATPLEVSAPRAFATGPAGWRVRLQESDAESLPGSESTSYAIGLAAADGMRGESKPWRLRIEADPPPVVEWDTPGEDLYLAPTAVIRVSGRAADNLAVANLTLVAKRGVGEAAVTQRVALWQGAADPPKRDTAFPAAADRQTGAAELPLGPMQLAFGEQLSLTLEAEDYRPGTGRATAERRVTIITPEELDELLADRQTQLLQAMQRALADQRQAREDARRADGALQAGAPAAEALDGIALAGDAQRLADQAVSEPKRGAAQLARGLLEQLTMNGAARPELQSQLEQVAERLDAVAQQAMNEASRALAKARQAVAAGEPADRSREPLAEAIDQQSAAAAELEALIDELGDWNQLERLATRLGELRDDLQQLQSRTARGAAAQAAGAAAEDGEQIAEEQADIARRFEKLQQAMKDAAQSGAPASDRVADALAQSQSRGTASKLRDAQRDVQQDALGRASQSQQSAAEDMAQMLDALRQQTPTDADKLASELREARDQLQKMRDQLDQARDQQARGENVSPQNEQLAQQAQQMAQKLDRLTAPDASQSAQSASGEMSQASQAGEQGGRQEEREAMEQADQDLADAQQKIDERLEELEEEQMRRILDQVAELVEGFIRRQTEALDGTLRADSERQSSGVEPAAIKDAIETLAGDERTLATDVEDAAQLAAMRKVFNLALLAAADELRAAAELLDRGDTGRETQRREMAALSRLKHVAQVLRREPPEPDPDAEQPPGDGGGQGGQQPPEGEPPIDIAELKLIRLMQVELKAQTAVLTADLADAAGDGPPAEQAKQRSAELAAQQRQLAELVQELMQRNNNAQGGDDGFNL